MTSRPILTRASPATLNSGDGRTVYGYALTWGERATVTDGGPSYTETFRRGAFTKTLQQRGDRIKVLALHDQRGRLPLGRATTVREDSTGLFVELRLSKTRAADEALELVQDGALDALSIGFRPIRDERDRDGTVIRSEVRLDEVSLVPFGSYEGALVSGVRFDPGPRVPVSQARARLAQLTLDHLTKG